MRPPLYMVGGWLEEIWPRCRVPVYVYNVVRGDKLAYSGNDRPHREPGSASGSRKAQAFETRMSQVAAHPTGLDASELTMYGPAADLSPIYVSSRSRSRAPFPPSNVLPPFNHHRENFLTRDSLL
jgi:hypothetical protein